MLVDCASVLVTFTSAPLYAFSEVDHFARIIITYVGVHSVLPVQVLALRRWFLYELQWHEVLLLLLKQMSQDEDEHGSDEDSEDIINITISTNILFGVGRYNCAT